MKSWYDLSRTEQEEIANFFKKKLAKKIVTEKYVLMAMLFGGLMSFYFSNSDIVVFLLKVAIVATSLIGIIQNTIVYERDFKNWLKTSKKIIK